MTATEYLRQVYYLDKLIDAHIKERGENRGLKALVPSGTERVQTSPSQDAIPNEVDKLLQFEKQIDAEIDALVNLKIEIHNKIEAIPDKAEQLVLTMRYLQFKEVKEILSDLFWTSSVYKRIHSSAIDKIQAMLDESGENEP